MVPRRVLLVDDSLEFLDAAASLLALDARVLVVGRAQNGRDAVRLAEALQPDLVLMDLRMPVMGGLDATRAIKALPSPPVVAIVTLRYEDAYRLGAQAAGADEIVDKAHFATAVAALLDALAWNRSGHVD